MPEQSMMSDWLTKRGENVRWVLVTVADEDFVRPLRNSRSANEAARLRLVLFRTRGFTEGNTILLSGGVMTAVESSDESSDEVDRLLDALGRVPEPDIARTAAALFLSLRRVLK
jgi:hypothetical protein